MKEERWNHGIGRPGHVSRRGAAAPAFHGRRSGGDGRRWRDGGGRARRTDRGELVPMSPKGLEHEVLKAALADRWYRLPECKVDLAIATTFRLSDDTYLEPD